MAKLLGPDFINLQVRDLYYQYAFKQSTNT